MKIIPLNKCKNGFIYEINSRNLSYGVFQEKTGTFIGIRTKFQDRFLFPEYHHEIQNGFGTVKPLRELSEIPNSIQLSTSLVDKETGTNLWAERDNVLRAVLRRDLTEKDQPHGKRKLFEDLWADTKERIPDLIWPRYIENKPLIELLDTISTNSETI